MTTINPIDGLEPTVKEWADLVIYEFEEKVRQYKIIDRRFTNSFESHVYWHSGGNLHKVEFLYDYYGKFVDMGVGRGVSLVTRDTQTARKPKPWFSNVFYRRLGQLRGLISSRTAQNIQFFIAQSIEDGYDLKKTSNSAQFFKE